MEKMDKRTLSAIPRPKVTQALQEIFRNQDRQSGIVTTSRRKVGGKDTLIVNVFRQKMGMLEPFFRIFCQMDGDITQDLTTDRVRWKQGGYAYEVGDWYAPGWGKSFTDYRCATEADHNRIVNFVLRYRKEHKIEIPGKCFNDYLNAYQEDIRTRRRIERNKKILDAFDRRMAQFGPLPEDYPEFIENRVFGDEHFLFYSRKEKFAYCTHCGSRWSLARERVMEEAGAPYPVSIMQLAHNADVTCPCCGKRVTAKSAGMGRGKLIFVKWSTLVQASGEDVLVRYIRHVKDFREDYRFPKTSSFELFRTVHGENGQEDYEWNLSQITNTYRWRDPRNRNGYFYPSEYHLPSEVILYNTDWECLKDTRLRYSCIDLYIQNIAGVLRESTSPWEIDKWFNFYETYPFAEQLMKLGWYQLVYQLMFRSESDQALKKMRHEKTVWQSMQMTKEQFRFLRKVTGNNPQVMDLCMIWHLGEMWVKLSEEDYHSFREMCVYPGSDFYKKLLGLCIYGSPHRIVEYLKKLECSNKGHSAIHDYLYDYIHWCRELKVNLCDEYNLLPPDFNKRHDEMAKAYKKHCDKQEQEKIAAFNRTLARMRTEITDDNPVNMHLEGLFIRLPEQIEELTKEGEVLHHCVATYADRVMQGKTAIFFIRKETAPDIPYFTMEWKDHRIIQCRGMHNCNPTPEVKAFTTIFSEKMLAFENGSTKPQRIRQKVKVG